MVIFRTLLFYFALIAVIRLLGKRQVGQMEPSEFVVTMLIANLAAVPLENLEMPVWGGLVPMGIIFLCERLISTVCLKSIRARRFLCGKPVILIENGRILQQNLRSTRVTLDELSGHLREKDVLDIRSVQYAILETNGNLSVFPYPANMPAIAKDAGIMVKPQYLPYTLVEDGVLLTDNLRKSGKDPAWVQRVLGEHRASLAGTWLLMVDQQDRVVWLGKEPA